MTPKELVQWRKKNGYSQATLGKALGVTSTTVWRWENELREIPSFLHLALNSLELKGGGETKGKGKGKGIKKSV